MEIFNPLDKKNLGETVVRALLESEVHHFSTMRQFSGAGIYAIYYHGESEYYRPISSKELNVPIYVGKAVPQGSRKGILTQSPSNKSLYSRLSEHKESISAAENLNVNDFSFRYLVVDDIWIPLGESLVINKFKPVWNVAIDGFGNHDPGKGRANSKKSAWDIIHPGRVWADKLTGESKTVEEIERALCAYYAE